MRCWDEENRFWWYTGQAAASIRASNCSALWQSGDFNSSLRPDLAIFARPCHPTPQPRCRPMLMSSCSTISALKSGRCRHLRWRLVVPAVRNPSSGTLWGVMPWSVSTLTSCAILVRLSEDRKRSPESSAGHKILMCARSLHATTSITIYPTGSSDWSPAYSRSTVFAGRWPLALPSVVVTRVCRATVPSCAVRDGSASGGVGLAQPGSGTSVIPCARMISPSRSRVRFGSFPSSVKKASIPAGVNVNRRRPVEGPMLR